MKNYSFYLKQAVPFFYGLALGLYFLTLTIVGKNFTHFPGDLGDARFNTYILEHGHKFITGKDENFWSAPFMYPEEKVITYSDNLIGSLPFYSIFRFMGFDRETAFQYWFITMVVLSYTACYLFLNWCFKNNYAAVLGSLIFAFSMALQSQMTHAQTFPRFPIPIAFWMCLLFMKELKPIYFFATLFTIVYQFYCGIYLGFFISIVIGLMFLFVLIYKWKYFIECVKNIKWVFLIIGAVIINILLFLPLIVPYIKRSRTVGFNSYDAIVSSIPTLRSFFFSQEGSLCWGILDTTAMQYQSSWDHQIFAGGVATLCFFTFTILLSLKLSTKNSLKKITVSPTIAILFYSCLTTFLLFTRYKGHSLYRLIYHIPGFGSMRSITRIINLELIYFAIATAFIFTLLIRLNKRLTIPLFLIFSILIIADNYYKEGIYRTEKVAAQARVNSLVEKMELIPEGAIVSYEPPEAVIDNDPIAHQIDAMLAAQTRNLKTVNGYSATSPYEYTSFWNQMSKEARKQWFTAKNVIVDTVYVIH